MSCAVQSNSTLSNIRFTGNVILKLSEGVLEFVVKLVAADVIGALTVEREKAGAALNTKAGTNTNNTNRADRTMTTVFITENPFVSTGSP